ncbi:MAG: TonB-dependent receptor [Bacteroidetes bacterium]|nr:MAG: TonB-dependent receptor [Bacteroidota bacterium]
MNHALIVVLLHLLPVLLWAQEDLTVTGRVVEAGSGQPLEYASVLLMTPEGERMVTGTNTDSEGRFSLTSDRADVSVEIRFMGFETKTLTGFSVENGQADLGDIALTPADYAVDDVEIIGERSSTEFQLDRRVFHVGQDLSSTGASALEILNNVPSVNVSIEGVVSLRGSSGVQILINGKPSVLASDEGNALGTLTADMIERIEVITNPSAKYDAEGTSGIINIVLRKEERHGLNGSATLNTGWPHNHSFGLSLNRRTENFNLFSQIGVGYRELPQQGRNINRNLVSGTSIESEGTEYRNEQFYNFILGTDYYINDHNVITLSGNFAYEVEDQPSRNDFVMVDADGNTLASWYREEVTEATNPKWQYELQYKRDFPENEDRALLFSAIGSFFGKDQASEFRNTTLEGQDSDLLQQTRTNFSEAENTIKLDYTHPAGENFTFETGAQYVLNDVSNDFSVSNFNDGQWVVDPTQTNIFDWNQKVLGLYGTGAYEGAKWGLKLGLRMENTDLNTLLRTTNEANDQNYNNFFPSAHTSYKLSERVSMQAGYSRRIFRPRLWDLNPFFNIRNNFNIRVGNPDLQPEFTDSYEVAAIFAAENFSMSSALYHRYTTEVVERVSFFDEGVTTVMPVNLGTNQAYGLEVNGKYSLGRWFSINGDFNLNWFQRRGELNGTSFDFNGDQFTTRLTSKFKFPRDWDFEVTGQYLSRVRTVQGQQSANLFMDLGLRKKILNGRGVFNFSVRDVFVSRFREFVVEQDDFYLYSWGRRGRFITLGFSYGFGKGEAMEFSGQKRF